jgi:hypothetical protein
VVLGGYALPVLPDAENECAQKDQAGRQQGEFGVESEAAVRRPVEFSCAS